MSTGGVGWRRALGVGTVQTVSLLALSFASIKVTAYYLGPAGLAVVSQMQSLANLCQGVIGNGLATGVTRLFPQYKKEGGPLASLLATALWLGGLGAFAVAVLMAVFSDFIARWVFADAVSPSLVCFAGFGVIAGVYAAVLRAAMHGAQEVGLVGVSNILGAVLGFLAFVAGVGLFGLRGGLWATALAGFLQLLAVLGLLGWRSSLAGGDFKASFARHESSRLLAFVPMVVAHIGMQQLSMIVIRQIIASRMSLDDAGFVQAGVRLAEVAMTVLTTGVGLFLAPKLGLVASDKAALRRLVWRVLLPVAGGATAISLVVIGGRDFFVPLIFSDRFGPVGDLLPWQFAGATIKTVAWTLGMVLVSLIRPYWYISLEVFVPLIFTSLSIFLLPTLGGQAIGFSHAVASLIQLIVAIYSLRDVLWYSGQGAVTGVRKK